MQCVCYYTNSYCIHFYETLAICLTDCLLLLYTESLVPPPQTLAICLTDCLLLLYTESIVPPPLLRVIMAAAINNNRVNNVWIETIVVVFYRLHFLNLYHVINSVLIAGVCPYCTQLITRLIIRYIAAITCIIMLTIQYHLLYSKSVIYKLFSGKVLLMMTTIGIPYTNCSLFQTVLLVFRLHTYSC